MHSLSTLFVCLSVSLSAIICPYDVMYATGEIWFSWGYVISSTAIWNWILKFLTLTSKLTFRYFVECFKCLCFAIYGFCHHCIFHVKVNNKNCNWYLLTISNQVYLTSKVLNLSTKEVFFYSTNFQLGDNHDIK